MIPKTVLFGVVIILVAYFYDPIVWRRLVRDLVPGGSWEERIARAWDQQIIQPQHRKKKIAVGINVNADLIVPGLALFEKLNLSPSGVKRDHSVLGSLTDLEEAFSLFFERGAGAERYYSDSKGFREILEAAEKLEEEQYFVGGNAALIALNAASRYPNVEFLLIGPSGPRVRDMISHLPNIKVPPTSQRESDEIHLILEYAKGDVWGDTTAPIATRFITSHDVANSEMDSLDNFAAHIDGFKPDAVVFSGLHLLDGKDPDFISQRIDELLGQLSQIPKNIPIHLELATMADRKLVTQLYTRVLGEVHSMGLNEQELSLIAEVTRVDPTGLEVINGHPDIPSVADILLGILRSKRKTTLTRIHFHCLTFHLIATRKGHWGNSQSAVAAGTRVAGMQACQDSNIITDKVELRVPKRAIAISNSPNHPDLRQFQPDDPVLKWEISDIEFYFSPVLVCKKPIKTVGLGDAISGTGLVYSDFVS